MEAIQYQEALRRDLPQLFSCAKTSYLYSGLYIVTKIFSSHIQINVHKNIFGKDLQVAGWGRRELDGSGSGGGQAVGACESWNESSSSIKCRKFLH